MDGRVHSTQTLLPMASGSGYDLKHAGMNIESSACCASSVLVVYTFDKGDFLPVYDAKPPTRSHDLENCDCSWFSSPIAGSPSESYMSTDGPHRNLSS